MQSHAQIFAVQSTSQLIPPYSVYLSDYATPGSEKLRVILVQRDLTQPSYQLRLVMEVMLNGKTILRTSRTFNPPPISLNPGIPTIISGADLAPYLDSRNIDFIGFSREQYERTRALPEGSYQINFTAYDFRRQDVVVSNVGSSFYYLSKNEPPLINFPACGSQVQLRTPQQIIFSWLPRNTASPNSAAETQYEFTLYETRPAGRNPNDVVASTQPILRTTVDNPQLIYGATEPMLMDNMNYVWRVRAIDREGKDAFRNNGYSEVCTFTYGGVDPNFSIGVVTGVQAEGETERRAKILWTKGDFDSYRVNYKKTGSGYEWFYDDVSKEKLLQDGTVNGELKVFDLEPNTEYETRIQGKKSGVAGGYSDIIKFRTLPLRVAHCGDEAPLPTLGNPGKPATSILVGTIIDADGFDIQLTQVESLGGGYFKGVGRVSVPYLGGAAFAVKFERLFINEDRVCGEGRIDFITQGAATMIETQMANVQLNAINKVKEANRAVWAGTDFYEKVFVYDQMEIEKVEPSGASMVNVYKRDGTVTANAEVMQVLNSVPEKAIIIQDKSGDQFVVQKGKDSEGKDQVKVTKVEGGGLRSESTTVVDVELTSFEKLILASLTKYKKAIDDYLASNTTDKNLGGQKSSGKFNLAMFAAELPSCLEEHKDKLKEISARLVKLTDSKTQEFRDFVPVIRSVIPEAGATQEKIDPQVCKELGEGENSIDELSCNPSLVPKVLKDIATRAKQCDDDVDDDLENISEADFTKLCVDQRLDVIKCIDDFPAQGGDDKILIKILKTTPVSHRQKLLSSLQDKKIYQDRLIEAVDGEEFIELVNLVSTWVGQPTQVNWEQAVISNRFIFFDGDDAFSADFTATGGMIFKTRKNFQIGWYQEVSCKPHDYVAVTFTNEFVIAGKQFNAGDQVTMSGLAVWSLFNEMFNKRMRAGGAVVLDIPLLFVGIGEINALRNAVAVSRTIRALRYAKATADIIIATGGLVMAAGLEDELTLTAEGREVLQYWTWFNLVYAGGTLTPHAISSAKGLYSSGKNLLTKPNLSASARASVQKWMETLKDIFKKQGKNIEESKDLIKSIDELKIFLGAVDESVTVMQLEQRGIKSFFRGTTRNKIDNTLYAGNSNSIQNGISTSADPVVATIFATESATANSAFKGVLQLAVPDELKNLILSAPNRRAFELEVIFKTSADDFTRLTKAEISVEDARKLVKEIYGIDIPAKVYPDGLNSSYELLNSLHPSLDKSFEFYQKALRYNVK